MADWYGKSMNQITDWLGEGKKTLFGDPEAIKAAYDQMAGLATNMTNQTRDFLNRRRDASLAYFGPLQHMFNSAYGTEGLQAPQSPQAAGVNPLAAMYGGR